MIRIAVVASLLLACDPDVTVSSDEVIRGFSANPATIPANGAATSVIRVETVPDDVKDGLKAKLTATAGTWLGAMGNSIEVDLGPDGLATTTLVASRIAGEMKVTAEIEGYQRTIPITFEAVAPTSFTSTTTGSLKAGEVSQVQITVTPTVMSGSPTAGTTVAFKLTATPADSAYLTTDKVVLDAAATSASTTVVAGTTTTSIKVDVSVSPPGSASPTATDSVTVQRVP